MSVKFGQLEIKNKLQKPLTKILFDWMFDLAAKLEK